MGKKSDLLLHAFPCVLCGIPTPDVGAEIWSKQGLLEEALDEDLVPPMERRHLIDMADDLRRWRHVIEIEHGQDAPRLENAIKTLDAWAYSLGRSNGIVTNMEVAQHAKFRVDTEDLLNAVRFTSLLKGGPNKLCEAIQKAVACVMPEFLIKSLNKCSANAVESGALPSPSSVRRGQFALDIAMLLMRKKYSFLIP